VHEVVPRVDVEDAEQGVALRSVAGAEAGVVEEPEDSGGDEREAHDEAEHLGGRAF
jgi:hypothetical protein